MAIILTVSSIIYIMFFNSCKKEDTALTERASVIEDYKKNYLGSAITDPGWTGDISSCNAGTSPQVTHDKVIKRMNYFRKLAGLNDNTTSGIGGVAGNSSYTYNTIIIKP